MTVQRATVIADLERFIATAEALGEAVRFGYAYDQIDQAWKVLLQCGTREIVHRPGLGRAFARKARARAERYFASMPEAQRAQFDVPAILSVWDKWEKACEWAIKLRKTGVGPIEGGAIQ